jgi:hypothetical protein
VRRAPIAIERISRDCEMESPHRTLSAAFVRRARTFGGINHGVILSLNRNRLARTTQG